MPAAGSALAIEVEATDNQVALIVDANSRRFMSVPPKYGEIPCHRPTGDAAEETSRARQPILARGCLVGRRWQPEMRPWNLRRIRWLRRKDIAHNRERCASMPF